MNNNELERLTLIGKVIERRLSKVQAAKILGVSTRQVLRLQRAVEAHGAEGLVSKKRGKISNRAYPQHYRDYVTELISRNYHDFGPTLVREKLADIHDIYLGIETLRSWMIQANLWDTRSKRRERAYQPRYRRDCYGELIQIDGSLHHWFEDRAPKCTLLVYIDDATSQIQHMHFCNTESTFDYFKASRAYIELYGKPVAFYSDKHATFRVNKQGAVGGTNMTQFGRALHELNIDIICANTAQAKGRVERANKTLQDRLVKELRLRDISTQEAANVFIAEFLEHYNSKFAKPPKNDKDMHRPLAEYDDLDAQFTWQEQRTVSKSLTIQYDRVIFLLKPSKLTQDLQRKKVTMYDYPDGRFEIRYEGVLLPYSIFDKVSQVNQGEIVSSKRLGAVLDFASKKAETVGATRSKKAPKRQGQSKSMFQ